MPRRAVSLRVDDGLWARVQGRADELGQSYTTFVVRALERALVEVGDAQVGRDASGHDVARASSLASAASARAPEPEVVDEPPERPPVVVQRHGLAAAERQARLNKAKGL